MVGIARWNLSPEARARFARIIEEAPRLGIDRDEVVAGGLPGLRALIALKEVLESTTHKDRARALAAVQDAVRTIAHRKYPKLASQFQARILALQGKGRTLRSSMSRRANSSYLVSCRAARFWRPCGMPPRRIAFR